MSEPVFVGFGFGAIQAGLFLYEAFRGGRFSRLVVAEVLPDVVAAVRANGGAYQVNVADPNGIRRETVRGVEIYNPAVSEDRGALVAAAREATELATALPSVELYGKGGAASVAGLLAEAGERPAAFTGGKLVYCAENHNHAAELLRGAVEGIRPAPAGCRFLNTVIGKMSGVLTDPERIERLDLAPLAPGLPRAFLVEAFNRILVSAAPDPVAGRGLTMFESKRDLLPFEEAKLYGHNATHALLGYLLALRGAGSMAEAADDSELLALSREAFLDESGGALCRKYAGVDALFTPAGYGIYVDDLLERMVNPHLDDRVERVTRDPRRKLGWNDRLAGTLRLCLSQGVRPERYALGAAAALRRLAREDGCSEDQALAALWDDPDVDARERAEVAALVRQAGDRL